MAADHLRESILQGPFKSRSKSEDESRLSSKNTVTAVKNQKLIHLITDCEQGDAKALFELAKAALAGTDVVCDKVSAYYLARLAYTLERDANRRKRIHVFLSKNFDVDFVEDLKEKHCDDQFPLINVHNARDLLYAYVLHKEIESYSKTVGISAEKNLQGLVVKYEQSPPQSPFVSANEIAELSFVMKATPDGKGTMNSSPLNGCDQGNAKALFHLAKVALKGEDGVVCDRVSAYYCAQLAHKRSQNKENKKIIDKFIVKNFDSAFVSQVGITLHCHSKFPKINNLDPEQLFNAYESYKKLKLAMAQLKIIVGRDRVNLLEKAEKSKGKEKEETREMEVRKDKKVLTDLVAFLSEITRNESLNLDVPIESILSKLQSYLNTDDDRIITIEYLLELQAIASGDEFVNSSSSSSSAFFKFFGDGSDDKKAKVYKELLEKVNQVLTAFQKLYPDEAGTAIANYSRRTAEFQC